MINVNLTREQKIWFLERMDESETGRVIVPTRLCDKLRKLADDPEITNFECKSYLIDNIYNDIHI